ncbi:phospholipid-translocating P-type ATPase, flippase family protein [Tritrichomonas foetus]|uniref:Phospholipid-transporting ATPase n=1 Tax=Tritrichomonas foetus TaxID=1144522 RepID=A0A1J4J765_9EUKA|nr:phospholipid-translocating P-type ATPase, flippase family protein [Tritrichomonas foetus]|eukprot:OHS95070.1 phospholipid-translocating P-type ATPase, flippase family protein [Tritrichomonas foetus]
MRENLLDGNADAPQYDEFDIGSTQFLKGIQPDNYVRTTRYTVFSFIPLTILENFKRVANIYFLLMTVVAFMPWSPITPVVQVLPLMFVIAISMLKELIEDLFRFRSDRMYNSILFEVFRGGSFLKIRSSDIRPGDLIRIQSNVEMPADVLILTTSEPGNLCFVNEVNLNGETAIKQRKALPYYSHLSVPDDVHTIKGHITIPMPCKDLRRLDGTLTVNGNQLSFQMKNCVLKGTFMAHTQWAVGVALYTGHDTRIIQNQRHPPHKTSQLDKRLNWIVGFDFAFNIAVVVLSTVMSMIRDKTLKFAFVKPLEQTFSVSLQMFTSFALIFSYMIPISLYVTIEFVRFFQRWTFSSDLGMYSRELGFCQPNNSNLNEELGQIEHVFSDKTGTLTENRMKFVQLSARGTIYDIESDKEHVKELVGQERALNEILACIAICHSVIISADGFSSESPDEEALVTTASELNAKFVQRVPEESISIELGGNLSRFQLLQTIEFDSDRKRMSVIVKAPNGQIILYTKGADTIMQNLFSSNEDEAALLQMRDQVDSWAEQGLRTLVCGWRLISDEEWTDFSQRMQSATVEMENREQKMKDVGATIEHDLILLGAVAIEDELQPNVADTMSYLALMGIKLWILTGDKHETAVSIAKSTNVITPECRIFEILSNDPNEAQTVLTNIKQQHGTSVLVLSPDSLEYITNEQPKMLAEFGDLCRSVICFRMSPFLKSKVVETMQTHTKKTCLAIGDGANDVNMIQTANVGIGIIGREGRQAASNSDFAITRFKHLKRLLAVHGRLSLVRLSGVIRYMIYKNIVFCFPHLWYFMYTNWSPATLFDGWLLATYNLIWTIFPPGEYGFFEQDVSFMSLMRHPVIYRETRSGKYLSWYRFALEVINGIYQSFILFYFNLMLPSNTIINSRGYTDGQVTSGVQLFVGIVIVVDMQTMIRSHHWNVFLFLGVVVSILIFFLFNLPYGSFASLVPQMYFVPQTLFTMYQPYLSLLISVIACLAPEAIFSYLKGMWFPSFTRIIRESELIEASGNKHKY